MSKVILIMDMPQYCIDCPCHFSYATGEMLCGKEDKPLLSDDIQTYKPDWCPLQDLPQRNTVLMVGEYAIGCRTAGKLNYPKNAKVVDGRYEGGFYDTAGEYGRALTAAMTSLDRRVPKKPIENHYEDTGELPYIKYACPNNCDIQLWPVTEKKYAYEHCFCPKCGQALDWEENNGRHRSYTKSFDSNEKRM